MKLQVPRTFRAALCEALQTNGLSEKTIIDAVLEPAASPWFWHRVHYSNKKKPGINTQTCSSLILADGQLQRPFPPVLSDFLEKDIPLIFPWSLTCLFFL